MTLPILYTFRRCPYAMRARMALYAGRINVEIREIDLKNKPSTMLTLSPKGTVPVMLIEDGRIIDESLDIMDYVHEQAPPLSWQKLSQKEFQQGLALILENDSQIASSYYRYKYFERFPDVLRSEALKVCEGFFEKLESQLNPYLFGSTQSYIDCALFPFVRQFSKSDPVYWQDIRFTKLKAWVEAMQKSDGFEDVVMRKFKEWQLDQKPVSFF